jgi:hypothetical protein
MNEMRVKWPPRGVLAGGLLAVMTASALAGVGAHGAEPRLVRKLEWTRPQITRALAVSRSELGLQGQKVAAEVRRVGGRDCVVGALVALDVDDTFAYDIDEPVLLTVEYAGTSTDPFTVAWDRNGGDGYAVATEVVPAAGTGPRTVTFRLDRARLAGQGILGTDVAIGAPRGGTVTVCDVRLSRPEPVASAGVGAPLSLTVLDAATGQAVPARVGLYSSTGRMPLPSDEAVPMHRYADEVRMQWLTSKVAWPLPHRSIFYMDGTYASTVPPGTYDLVVSRGLEYYLHRSQVVVPESGAAVTVRLDRYVDMPAAGWYSGESHVHLLRDQVDDMAVWTALAAEDLHLSNLLEMGNIMTTYYRQPKWGSDGIFGHQGRFLVSGQEDPRTVIRGHTMHWNTGQHVHEQPQFFQYHTIFEKTRAAGAIPGYAHFGQSFNGHRGLALDVPFGLAEYIEVLQGGRINTDVWYSFLNLGYRVLPVGGADYPYYGPTLPGVERTYVKVDGTMTPAAWFAGFRQGQVFVSNGPMLDLSVNGQPMGSELRVPRGTPLTVSALTRLNPDIDALDRLELVVLGDIERSVPARGNHTLALEAQLTADRSMWIAVRAYGRHQENQLNTLAHSAPVYVVVDDEPTWKRDAVPSLVARHRASLQDLRTSIVDPIGDLEAWETSATLVAEWKRQLPLLTPRIEEADRRYQSILDRWKRSGS